MTRSPLTIDEFAADFGEEPGYLDFASVGPIGRSVAEEETALRHVLEHARFGSLAAIHEQEQRMRAAVGELIGFRAASVAPQPSTSYGLLHAAFGVTGGIVLSVGEFPALTYAAARAASALGSVQPRWIEPEHGVVTPGELTDLDASVEAVMVSLVDFRTGFVADLDGIRQVIGDRLLIVDATQGIGVVDAPFGVADVVAAGGQKWLRAGWGTGFLAMSDAAVERLTPVWSGFVGSGDDLPLDEVREPSRSASAFGVAPVDPIAQARLAVAVERTLDTGVGAIAERIADRAERVISLADEHGVPIASPRAVGERAGIVVLDPGEDRLTPLVAALHNHGISATARDGRVRLAVHVSTDEDTLELLGDALTSYGTTIRA